MLMQRREVVGEGLHYLRARLHALPAGEVRPGRRRGLREAAVVGRQEPRRWGQRPRRERKTQHGRVQAIEGAADLHAGLEGTASSCGAVAPELRRQERRLPGVGARRARDHGGGVAPDAGRLLVPLRRRLGLAGRAPHWGAVRPRLRGGLRAGEEAFLPEVADAAALQRVRVLGRLLLSLEVADVPALPHVRALGRLLRLLRPPQGLLLQGACHPATAVEPVARLAVLHGHGW
mmetsp:Transcript_95622/g.270559  ORF Transcript_95622/g.270559 Transcript_95622/m.270559 type:complete len:233 (+) Transcript_95622:1145-1843(+)